MTKRSIIDETDFQSQPSVDVSAEMEAAIQQINADHESARKTLEDLARDVNAPSHIRLGAAQQLYLRGNALGAQTLRVLVNDPDPGVRFQAALMMVESPYPPTTYGPPPGSGAGRVF